MLTEIATIIPFCRDDMHLVGDAIDSIIKQTVPSLIFVVGDGVHPEDIRAWKRPYNNVPNIVFYCAAGLGPYVIANSIVRLHTNKPYIALQDADDISYPTRLEKQLEVLKDCFEHTSAAMKQTILGDYKGDRHLREPTLLCGVTASNVPYGRYINSTRMFRRDTFLRLNGFANMFCSGDLAFDNVIRILGIPSYEFKQVLAERRLHSASLTNNPRTSRLAPKRQACMDRMKLDLALLQQSPTLETAQRIGSLNSAPQLEFIQ